MPLAIALEALKATYRDECEWLRAWAYQFETGRAQVFSQVDGVQKDISPQMAIDYRHRAANLEHILQAYDRLNAKA